MKKIFRHQWKENQNYLDILSHPSPNGYHQENKNGKNVSKKELLLTVGGIVN
jgi:hypothetical protein